MHRCMDPAACHPAQAAPVRLARSSHWRTRSRSSLARANVLPMSHEGSPSARARCCTRRRGTFVG